MRKIPPGFHREPQQHPDGPDIADGLRLRDGVTYGCGQYDCKSCYEPDPRHPATAIIEELRRQVKCH